MRGYLERAAADAGLSWDKELKLLPGETLSKNPKAVDAIIRKFRPTALFGMSDYLVRLAQANCPHAAPLEMLGFFDVSHSRQPGNEFSSFKIDFARIWERGVGQFRRARTCGSSSSSRS